jgi:hypothetical protein
LEELEDFDSCANLISGNYSANPLTSNEPSGSSDDYTRDTFLDSANEKNENNEPQTQVT